VDPKEHDRELEREEAELQAALDGH